MERTITSLFDTATRGDRVAAEELFATLYSELRRLARRELGRVGAAGSLGTTSLVHEAYLELAAREPGSFPDRARFMGYMARAMRGLIIDHARSHRALKRGGKFELTSLDTRAAEHVADDRTLTEISEALDQLTRTEPSLVEIVDLKFFCGFSFAEIAAMQGVSERTVQRKWEKARIYLHRSLRSSPAVD